MPDPASNPSIIEDKFVRIQFIIDLKTFHTRPDTEQLKCVYWSFTQLKWLSDGCFVSTKESGLISATNVYRRVCYCDHLTNFAILFDQSPIAVSSSQRIRELFENILTTLTLIGVVVSSVCYLITILTRCFFKRSANYRDDTLRFLYIANALCLLCANIFFLILANIQSIVYYKTLTCQLSATGLHYFLLTAFCFSLATAWEHFKRLVRVFPQSNKVSYSFELMLAASVLGPLVLTIIGFLSDSKTSAVNEDLINCWLKPPQLYYLFIIPMTILLLLSLNLYIFVSIKVSRVYRNKAKLATGVYDQKRVVVILTFSFISLGLTWLLGILIVISAQLNEHLKLAMDFLFCLFNAFHGLSLLIAHLIAQRFHNPENQKKSKSTDNPKLIRSHDMSSRLESSKRKLSIRSHFFLYFYGTIYRISRLFGCKRKDSSPKQESVKATFLDVAIISDVTGSDIRTSTF